MGHPRGTILVEVRFRILGTARWEKGSRWGAGGEKAEGGGGSDLSWRIEVVPSSPRRSGGGLTGGGSILSLALSLCLSIRFLSLGRTRIPGTENGAITYASVCGKEGEVEFPVKKGLLISQVVVAPLLGKFPSFWVVLLPVSLWPGQEECGMWSGVRRNSEVIWAREQCNLKPVSAAVGLGHPWYMA